MGRPQNLCFKILIDLASKFQPADLYFDDAGIFVFIIELFLYVFHKILLFTSEVLLYVPQEILPLAVNHFIL